MKKLSFLLLYLVCINFVSQTKESLFYAQVHDKIDIIYNAHIINLNSKKGTFTNQKGEFRIHAKEQDTLQISFIGYKTKIFIVTINNFGLQKTKIELIKKPIELDEVALKKNNLLGYLDLDSKHIKTEKKIDAKSLKLPNAGSRILTPAERRLHTAMTSGAGIPIDPFLNWISGRLKKLKKLKALEDKEKRIKKINDNYLFFIEQKLNILTEDISRFVYYCEESKEFNSSFLKNRLKMIKFLKERAKKFKSLNAKKYTI